MRNKTGLQVSWLPGLMGEIFQFRTHVMTGKARSFSSEKESSPGELMLGKRGPDSRRFEFPRGECITYAGDIARNKWMNEREDPSCVNERQARGNRSPSIRTGYIRSAPLHSEGKHPLHHPLIREILNAISHSPFPSKGAFFIFQGDQLRISVITSRCWTKGVEHSRFSVLQNEFFVLKATQCVCQVLYSSK